MKYRIGIIVGLTATIFFLGYYLRQFYVLKETTLDEQLAGKPPLGLIMVDHVSNEPKSSIYRFPDLKESPLPGTWEHRFLSYDTILTYGFDQTSANKQYLAIINQHNMSQKSIGKMPGKILAVEASKSGNYLVISGEKNRLKDADPIETYTCIVKTIKQDYGSNCTELFGTIIKQSDFDAASEYNARWSTKDGKDYLIIYNLTNPEKSIQVDPETQAVSAANTVNEDSGSETLVSAETFGPLTKLTNSKTGNTHYFLSPNNALFFSVTPADDRILMLHGQKLYLVDPAEKKKTELFTLPEGEYRISTHAKPN